MVSSLFYHKQGFHVARAETPPHERDLASELHLKTSGNSGEIELARKIYIYIYIYI